MNSIYLRLVAVIGAFIVGVLVSNDYTAKKYQAEISQIERDHATDLADQLSMADAMLSDSIEERNQREVAYRHSLVKLAERSLKRETKLNNQLRELTKMEKSNEEVRRLGDVLTPDVVVEWLQ